MAAVTLIFPHQLFKNHPAVKKGQSIYLIEEELFFNQYNFHKKKLILHRASMKYYADYLQKKGYVVHYVEASAKESSIEHLIKQLPKKVNEIHYADVTDDWLQQRIAKVAAKREMNLVIVRTPCFLNNLTDVKPYFEKHPSYFQTDFYIDQRKQRNLLLEKDGGPLGGKWTYDAENRLKFPKGNKPPAIRLPTNKKYVSEAIDYVTQSFKN